MDILYYVGSGSHHQNRELQYSLRSLQKHCKDMGDVWIVGNKPAFLNENAKYLWVEDKGEWWQNAFYKTMAAIEAGISQEFLLMNDDFFMTKDFFAAKYPYFHRGELPEANNNQYQHALLNTKRILQRAGKSVYHYGVHCPMRIEAEKYKQLKPYYEQGGAVSARCLYGNLFCHGQPVEDCKGDGLDLCNKLGCCSTRNWISQEVFAKLAELYPEPSIFEN